MFHEVQFPTDISYGVHGGATFSTEVAVTDSGYEQRNCNWENSKAIYEISHAIKSQAQMDILIAFFRARKGKAIGFRYKDWVDYKGNQQVIGYGDGEAFVFQLIKNYQNGDIIEKRLITKPVVNTVLVYIDDKPISSGVVIDYTTGQIFFDEAPIAGAYITADFEFDVPVRFDTDQLDITIESFGVFSWNDIIIKEIIV